MHIQEKEIVGPFPSLNPTSLPSLLHKLLADGLWFLFSQMTVE
jgi:hypothetical protein